MSKKVLEKTCIMLIIIVFVIIGYYTYKSYDNKRNIDDSDVEINNFYNVDYLFNNSYIDTPKTIEDFSSGNETIYMYLDAENVMYIKYSNNEKYNKKIIGLPKGKINVYYNHLYDNYYEFLAKTEDNNAYYLFVNLDSTKDEKYIFIGDNIDKVFAPVYDKNGVYINQKNKFATNYILYDSEAKLNYIDTSLDKKYVLKSNVDTKKPYFDYICASNNPHICNKYMIYITFNDELVYNKKYLKDNNNQNIYVKDVFSSFEVSSKADINIETLNKDSLKKYDYKFSTYIIDNNQIAYQFDVSNKGERIISLNDASNKVKEYVFESDKKLIIIFEDGSNKTIKAEKNKVLTTSTVYDRNQNSDKKVIIQP